MNIDERLERLVERHEALAQTVELLAKDIREMQAAQREMQAAHDASMAEITRVFEIALDTIQRLENIASAREQRIQRLEDGTA